VSFFRFQTLLPWYSRLCLLSRRPAPWATAPSVKQEILIPVWLSINFSYSLLGLFSDHSTIVNCKV
jgi:hypothetical protein